MSDVRAVSEWVAELGVKRERLAMLLERHNVVPVAIERRGDTRARVYSRAQVEDVLAREGKVGRIGRPAGPELDEQRVRTHAGWIGVEISKSRVRTPGRPGYGLYRVRGSVARSCGCGKGRGEHVWAPGEWTAYAYTLAGVDVAVRRAIELGMPDRPGALTMQLDPEPGVEVPTRWTSAYRGRRNLGVRSLGDDLAELERSDPAVAAAAASYETAKQAILEGPVPTVRRRQREQNAAFQAEHKVRRDHGLAKRHAHKLALPVCPVTDERCSRCGSAEDCAR